MARLHWSPAMSVGVPSLDGDHRCLVRIIGLLEEATAADIARMIGIVLDTLLVYGRYHFAREERVMAACGFPGLDIHRAEHAGFTKAISALGHRHRLSANLKVAAELRSYLADWLLHHILIQDMAYKPFVCDPQIADASLQIDQPGVLEMAPPDLVAD